MPRPSGVSRFRIWLSLGSLLVGSVSAGGAAAFPATPSVPPTIELTTVEASARQLDIGARESVDLTTLLPIEARETIIIKDMKGHIIRSLVDRCRPSGIYEDAWDGKGEGGKRLLDGQYRWVATFDDGLHTFTIDRSKELDGDFEVKSHPEYSAWNPFENIPLRFSVNFEKPGEIVLVFSHDLYYVTPRCDPPKFYCRFLDGYQPAGEFTYEWAGVDDTGARREDIHAIFVISHHEELSKNAIVVHGGRPEVSKVTALPTYFRPDAGPLRVSFLLRAFRDESAAATITFTNQETRSVLRTLSLARIEPGNVTATWDGRAENGMRVAPGGYTISVTVTDSVGHKASGQILTTVAY